MVKKRIETKRLVIRNFESNDAKDFFALTRDQDIQEYVSYACTDTLEETIENINDCYVKGDFVHDYYCVLEEKETHNLIGALINTENFNGTELEMCLLLSKEYRRKGFMTEALKGFIASLPHDKKLSFVIRTDNTPSIKTVQALGATKLEKEVSGFNKFILTT